LVATAHPFGKRVPQTADKPKETEPTTMFNKITLVGRLGQNAEVKTSPSKSEYVTLPLADVDHHPLAVDVLDLNQ
jgi:hypothetical protein